VYYFAVKNRADALQPYGINLGPLDSYEGLLSEHISVERLSTQEMTYSSLPSAVSNELKIF
jgi:hypothetical protein